MSEYDVRTFAAKIPLADEVVAGIPTIDVATFRLKVAGEIEFRILQLEGIHENYLRYQDDRVAERDHHGAWDVAINLAETEAELAGLRFALETLSK